MMARNAGKECWNNLATSLIVSTRLLLVVDSLLADLLAHLLDFLTLINAR